MTYAKLCLGRYVATPHPPRRDGTVSVLFVVPKRLRPEGWPATIPLPFTGERRGNLNDPDEVARIIADAETLYKELSQDRAPQVGPAFVDGSIPHLVQLWRHGWDKPETAIGPRTQTFYRKTLPPILAWSEINKHRHVKTITPAAIRTLLDVYGDRPARRQAIRSTLSVIMAVAVEAGHISINPVQALRKQTGKRRGRAKRAVDLWRREDVEAYVATAMAIGWPGGARLLLAMWETAADRSDVVTWRKNSHYRAGAPPAIVFDRGKTGVAAEIPISARLAALWEAGDIYLVTDAKSRHFDGAAHDNRLDGHMKKLKAAAVASGARPLLFDHLRHSAATEAFAAGFDLDHVRGLTAHATDDMLRQTYVQQTADQVLRIQRARGVVD